MGKIFLWKSMESAGTGRPEDDFAPYLEPYLLENTGDPRGCVIVFPGGGYCNRAPHEAGPIAERFNQMGFHAFVLQYRVAPYRYPAPQRDALRAVRLVRSRAAEWGIAPDRIATLGFSAGGHLCASTGTLYDEVDSTANDAADLVSPRPDALILCYAVIDLTEPFGHFGSGENLLGKEGVRAPEAKRLNLETRVTADTPPSFLWHTAEDNAVPVENSLKCGELARFRPGTLEEQSGGRGARVSARASRAGAGSRHARRGAVAGAGRLFPGGKLRLPRPGLTGRSSETGELF